MTEDSNYVTDIWNNFTDVNAEKVLISVDSDAIKQKGKGCTDMHWFLIDKAAVTEHKLTTLILLFMCLGPKI